MTKDLHAFTLAHTADLDAYFAEMMKDPAFRRAYNAEKNELKRLYPPSKNRSREPINET